MENSESRDREQKVELAIPKGMTAESFKQLLAKAMKAPAQSNPEDLVVFKEWDAGTSDKMRVYRDVYKSKEVNSLRRWYTDKEDGLLKPGKGATFNYEDIDGIIEGLQAMKAWHEEVYSSSKGSEEAKEEDERTEQGND